MTRSIQKSVSAVSSLHLSEVSTVSVCCRAPILYTIAVQYFVKLSEDLVDLLSKANLSLSIFVDLDKGSA